MGDKANAHPGAAGRATTAGHPASVRNVVLVGHSGSGKTTLVEALALAAGAVNRAGRVEDGGDRLRPRRDRAPPAALRTAVAGPDRLGRLQDQPTGHPRIRRLRRRTQGRSASGGRGPVRRLGGGRHGRLHPDALGGVRGRRHAAGDRGHAPRGGPRRLRRDDRRSARAPSAATTPTPYSRSTCRRTARRTDGHAPVTGLIGLLSQRVFDYSRVSARRSSPTPSSSPLIEQARNPLIEGIIAESEDETLMDRYLARRGHRLQVAGRRSGARGRARHLPPGPGRGVRRRRRRGTASA